MCSRSRQRLEVSERPAIGSGQKRHANAQQERGPAYQILRKGEPKSRAKTGPSFKRPGAATRYIIARRHIAERHHAPTCSRFTRLISFKDTKAFGSQIFSSRAESPGWRLKWSRCRGLGEYLCWGKLALIRLAAAHGQITERKYSVTRVAINQSLSLFQHRCSLRFAG